MDRPREITIAQGMLWLALGMSGFNFAVAQANYFDLLPFAHDSQNATFLYQIAGAFSIVLQVFCVVSVGRGHGLIRWPLLLGAVWIFYRLTIDRSLWDSELLAPYYRIEPLGVAIKTGALTLLFLPRSNAWFRERQGARREKGKGAARARRSPAGTCEHGENELAIGGEIDPGVRE